MSYENGTSPKDVKLQAYERISECVLMLMQVINELELSDAIAQFLLTQSVLSPEQYAEHHAAVRKAQDNLATLMVDVEKTRDRFGGT